MKAFCLSSLLTLTCLTAFGQTDLDSLDIDIDLTLACHGEVSGDVITDPIEAIARFPISYDSIKVLIKQNLNWNQGNKTIVGRSYVEFIVMEDGSISDAKIVKGLCESCDRAAIEVLKTLPKLIPAKDSVGQLIIQKMIIPIQFDM